MTLEREYNLIFGIILVAKAEKVVVQIVIQSLKRFKNRNWRKKSGKGMPFPAVTGSGKI
jgi:hypothetical protein